MYKHFRSGGAKSAPAKQFHYRGRPKAGGFSGGHGGGKGGFGGRKVAGGGRSRYGGGGNRGGGFGRFIDPAKFVNKAPLNAPAAKPVHYTPEHNFIDFAIDNRLKTNIVAKNYFVPTPIQDKIIPHILAGSDVVGIANTGTGKTAAFLIPLIDKVLRMPNERILIMVPTRELAQQINEEFMVFANRLNMQAVCVVGGASMGNQMKILSRQPAFIIGTPGRLKDLMERRAIDLSRFGTVVLDEADRMLDMGFINDVKLMMSKMHAKRHTLFFSATMSREIETLVHTFLKNPVTISVKTGETPNAIDQDVVKVPVGKNKLDILSEILAKPGFDKVLIFGRTKHGVERLAKDLTFRGFKAESIHGNKSQPQRQKALSLFKAHHMKVLVATDVAARGLDIVGVSHVINYDQPATYDDYIHRIGRTGRAGKQGRALTFV
jgi:superfamily II DNA/RNA helicase